MKKILSIILTIILCFTMAACKAKKEPQKSADFSRTAGVWFESGSPDASRLVMDGKGAITSLYPDGIKEFDGFLGYDAEDDTYSIYTADEEYIAEFAFDSDTQIHIGNDKEIIYVKSDESLDIEVPVLTATNPLPISQSITADPDYHGGYFYSDLADDRVTTITNTCFTSTMETGEIIESYIVKCIAGIGEGDISDIKIEENIDYTNTMQQHVYLVSWKSGEKFNNAFFFRTNTHTYMYVLSSDKALSEDVYLSIFDGLHLTEE